jgi:hypothetical protein
MASFLDLQAAYKLATTRTDQDRLLAKMQAHPDRYNELIYDGQYVTVYQQPLGALVLRPTAELLAEYDDPQITCHNGLVHKDGGNWNNPDKLWDILEDWLCNSEYSLVSSDETGDLVSSDCPIILKDCDRSDDGVNDIIGYSDKWYFSQYAVRNEYYDLYGGCLILDKA